MPIKSCTLPGGGSGYQWGDRGTCYSDRKDAEKQAAAAHANGYVGDIALDSSARTIDTDGRMHIERSHISKAMVCPYYGREIPGCDSLGLDPQKIYQLFRAPESLESGAASFARNPILSRHVPVTADAPRQDLIVGSIGSDVSYNAPYLDADISIWDAKAIAGIETDAVKELSCAYHFVPVMTPGTYLGKHYDGIMTEIRGNHLALVESGRAGSDVVAADAAFSESDHPRDPMGKFAEVSTEWTGSSGEKLRMEYALHEEQDHDDFMGYIGPKTMSVEAKSSVNGVPYNGINHHIEPVYGGGKIVAKAGQIGLTKEKKKELEQLRAGLEQHPLYQKYLAEQKERTQRSAKASREYEDHHARVIKAMNVSDSNPFKKVETMKMTKLGKALYAAFGAASPKLAQDAALPALVGEATKKTLDKAKVTKALIAMDSSLKPEQLGIVMDAISDMEDDPEPTEKKEKEAKDNKTAKDEESEESEEEKKEREKKEKEAKDKKMAKDKEDEEEKAKKEPDEKVKTAMDSFKRELREAEEAKRTVRPTVGDVIAQDSAENIYVLALDHMKVDHEGVTGVPALKALYKVAAAKSSPAPRIAQDSATVAARFPNFNRVRQA